MSDFHDSAAGSPTAWSNKSFFPSADSGAGDSTAYADFSSDPVPLALGAGDPFIFSAGPFIPWKPIPWFPGGTRFSIDNSFDNWVSWEGGYLLGLVSVDGPLQNFPYRVDFVDIAGQPHPILEPGTYSATQGNGSEVWPEPDGVTIIFSTPPLPIGTYSLKVTNQLEESFTIPDFVKVMMTPDSLEVESIRGGLDAKVYPGAFPDKEYPDG